MIEVSDFVIWMALSQGMITLIFMMYANIVARKRPAQVCARAQRKAFSSGGK